MKKENHSNIRRFVWIAFVALAIIPVSPAVANGAVVAMRTVSAVVSSVIFVVRGMSGFRRSALIQTDFGAHSRLGQRHLVAPRV